MKHFNDTQKDLINRMIREVDSSLRVKITAGAPQSIQGDVIHITYPYLNPTSIKVKSIVDRILYGFEYMGLNDVWAYVSKGEWGMFLAVCPDVGPGGYNVRWPDDMGGMDIKH